jgi:hypothetical protein
MEADPWRLVFGGAGSLAVVWHMLGVAYLLLSS